MTTPPSCIAMSKTSKDHGHIIHIVIKCQYLKENVASFEIKLKYCHIDQMLGDIFIKVFPKYIITNDQHVINNIVIHVCNVLLLTRVCNCQSYHFCTKLVALTRLAYALPIWFQTLYPHLFLWLCIKHHCLSMDHLPILYGWNLDKQYLSKTCML